MRWLHRAAIGAQIIGWLDIALFVLGIPGHIDDTTTYVRWIALLVENSMVLVVAIGFAISGPLLWTSSWWLPRIPGRKRGQIEPLTIAPISSQIDNDLVCFTECLPHVQRCRELIRPYAGTGGQFKIAVQVLGDRDVFAEIATELEYVAKQLSALGIWSPNIWGEEGNDSLDKVHSRLRDWSFHLARLEAKIHQTDLEGMRNLYN